MQAKYPHSDIIFLRLDKTLKADAVPQRDSTLYPGCPYILCGSSNRSHDKPYSISHGSISTTRSDSRGFIRGDTASNIGDSGGGCFSLDTGSLIAINVGSDDNNLNRAMLVPVAQLDAFRAALPPEKPLASWPACS